MRDIIRN